VSIVVVITALPSCSGSNHCWASCCNPYPLPAKGYHCCGAELAWQVCWQCRKGSWSNAFYIVYAM